MRIYLFREILTDLQDEFDIEIADKDLVVDVRPDGRPWQVPANIFVVAHGYLWEKVPEPDSQALLYNVGVEVTVTKRLDNIPFDTLSELLIPERDTATLDEVLHRVMIKLHNSYSIMARANAASTYGMFTTPLQYQDTDFEIEFVDATWFRNDDKANYEEAVGIKQSVRFSDATFAATNRCGDNTFV